jgi:hypothetical protein
VKKQILNSLQQKYFSFPANSENSGFERNITMFQYAEGQNFECQEFINLWRRELASNLLLFYLICALDIPSPLKLFVFYVDEGVLLLSSQYRGEGRNCQMLSEMSTSTLAKKESGAVL